MTKYSPELPNETLQFEKEHNEKYAAGLKLEKTVLEKFNLQIEVQVWSCSFHLILVIFDDGLSCGVDVINNKVVFQNIEYSFENKESIIRLYNEMLCVYLKQKNLPYRQRLKYRGAVDYRTVKVAPASIIRIKDFIH